MGFFERCKYAVSYGDWNGAEKKGRGCTNPQVKTGLTKYIIDNYPRNIIPVEEIIFGKLDDPDLINFCSACRYFQEVDDK